MDSPKPSTLIRRSIDTDLMPPPPPKRIKRPKNVIDEEAYTDAISKIIARDFFPGLLEAEIQQEYLDALESQDAAWVESAGRRLQQVMTPGRRTGRRGTTIPRSSSLSSETPRGIAGDTPSSGISDLSTAVHGTALMGINTNMSLDKFQSLYTSEDNESFYKLLDKQNQKKAEKYAWMWSGNNKLPSKMMLKQKEIETKLLLSRDSLRDNGGDKDRIAIQHTLEKPSRPDSWNSKPNNELMFAPDSVEGSIETVAQKSQNDSNAAPRRVIYANTRMPAPGSKESPNVPPSPSLTAVKAAIAGRRRSLDLESGFGGIETPRVNGYTFVDDHHEDASYSSSQVINLSEGQLIKNPFVIKEQSKREELHHRIVDKTARTKRGSSKYGMTGRVDKTPIPKFPSSPRVGSGQLTPAGQRLWSKVGPQRESTTFGVVTPVPGSVKSRLRAQWTPSK